LTIDGPCILSRLYEAIALTEARKATTEPLSPEAAREVSDTFQVATGYLAAIQSAAARVITGQEAH
jgi:hypothetical protein